MSNVYHSHITIRGTVEEAKEAAKLIKGKATIIELENQTQTQRDIMITNYYVIGHKGLETFEDIYNKLISLKTILQKADYDVARVKLEHEDPAEENYIDKYYEVHLKYIVEKAKLHEFKQKCYDLNWRPSNNPYQLIDDDTVVQFVNNRFKVFKSVDKEIEAFVSNVVDETCQLKEIKNEAVVYDSNVAHDMWWL